MNRDQQVTLIHKDRLISIVETELIQSKTAEQIIQQFYPNESNETIIGIRTKTNVEIINQNVVPLELCPDLSFPHKINEISIPDFSLTFLDQEFKNKDIFVIHPSCTNIPNLIFPPFIYGFSKSDNSKPISRILEEIKEYFGMKIQNERLFLNDEEINNCSFSQFITKAKNNRKLIKFEFSLEAMGHEQIKIRQTKVQELIDLFKKFSIDMIQLNHQVGPNIKKAHIFTDYEYSIVFDPIPDIFNACSKLSDSLDNLNKYHDFIAHVFLSAIPDIYENFKEFYANYYTDIEDLLKRHKNNQILKNVMYETFDKNTNSFQSMTILPIQTVPRIPLILLEILKKTPKSHPEFYVIKRLIIDTQDLINRLTNYNLVRDVIKLQQTIIPLEENINNPLDTDGRFLVGKYNVNYSLYSKSTLYLLSDVILLTIKTDTREFEKFRVPYDKFCFFPNVSASAIIVKYKGQFSALKFSSSEAFEDMMKNLVERRAEMIKNNPEMNNLLVGIEYVPFKTQSIPSTIGSSSCCKISNLIMSASYRVLMTLDTRHDKSLNVEKNVKSIHMYGKLVSINNVPYIYGGEAYPTPLEFVNGKFVEVKPKITTSSQNNAIASVIDKEFVLNNVSQISNPKDGRMYHTCCAYKKYIVIYGGYKSQRKNNRWFSSDVYFFNIDTAEWFCSNPGQDVEPDARYKHSAVVYKNLMIIHGGISCLKDELLDDTWCYDFNNGKWTQIDRGFKPIVTPRFGHAATMVGKYMFIIGGLTLSRKNENIMLGNDYRSDSCSSSRSDLFSSNSEICEESQNEDNDNENSNSSDDSNVNLLQSSRRLVGATSCFCLDIEKLEPSSPNITGNFLPGLSMCSAIYNESTKQIFVIGGHYLNNREDKNTPVFIQVSVPKFYTSKGVTESDINIREMVPCGSQLLRKRTSGQISSSSSTPIPENLQISILPADSRQLVIAPPQPPRSPQSFHRHLRIITPNNSQAAISTPRPRNQHFGFIVSDSEQSNNDQR